MQFLSLKVCGCSAGSWITVGVSRDLAANPRAARPPARVLAFDIRATSSHPRTTHAPVIDIRATSQDARTTHAPAIDIRATTPHPRTTHAPAIDIRATTSHPRTIHAPVIDIRATAFWRRCRKVARMSEAGFGVPVTHNSHRQPHRQ